MLLALCWCLPLLAAQTDDTLTKYSLANCGQPLDDTLANYSNYIAPLVDPAKLATLGPRGGPAVGGRRRRRWN